MDINTISEWTDEQLMEQWKQNKPSPMLDAFLIGFLIGILIFSAAVSSWGLVSLVPLFLIYSLLKKPKRYKAMKKELEKRGLKIDHE